VSNPAWNAQYAAEINNNVTGIDVYKGHLYVYGLSEGFLKKINLKTGDIRTLPVADFIESTHGLEVTEDTIWITDTKHHQVYKLDVEGNRMAAFGERGVKGCDQTHFNKPTDVAIAPNGHISVTDGYGNRRVVCLDANGHYLFEWGKDGTGHGEFMNPHDIVIVNSKIYVADRDNNRVQIFTMQGRYLDQWPQSGKVFGLCYADGKMYMTIQSEEDHYIQVADMNGNVLQKYGRHGKAAGEFDVPHSLTVDENFIYVAEVGNKRIQRIDRSILNR
jgi:DNA-binding beta-propeller fold protein YncE